MLLQKGKLVPFRLVRIAQKGKNRIVDFSPEYILILWLSFLFMKYNLSKW